MPQKYWSISSLLGEGEVFENKTAKEGWYEETGGLLKVLQKGSGNFLE